MSATGHATGSAVCGEWMPRKQTYCARGAGHPPPCASPEAMEAQRQRSAESRPTRVVTSESKARWNRTHKFVRFGITPDRFNQMLEEQGDACAICRTPFKKGQRICFDHDHSCCPVPASGHTISCGDCLRGLLCMQCNTRLGWLETYGNTIGAYLEQGRA
jgi:Recombination endonuclease VII